MISGHWTRKSFNSFVPSCLTNFSGLSTSEIYLTFRIYARRSYARCEIVPIILSSFNLWSSECLSPVYLQGKCCPCQWSMQREADVNCISGLIDKAHYRCSVRVAVADRSLIPVIRKYRPAPHSWHSPPNASAFARTKGLERPFWIITTRCDTLRHPQSGISKLKPSSFPSKAVFVSQTSQLLVMFEYFISFCWFFNEFEGAVCSRHHFQCDGRVQCFCF